MCAELIDDLEMSDWPSKLKETCRADIARARALLAQAVAEGPTDEELLRVAATGIEPYEISGITPGEYEPETECAVEAYGSELIAFAREVLHRWGRPTPQPVADGEVAELVAWLRESLDSALQSGNSKSIKNHCRLLGVLGRPTPQPPADGEVAELVSWLQSMRDLAGEHNPDEQRRYTRAAELLGRPTPQPVAEGPADGEVAAALIELRSTVMGLDQMKMYVAAQRVKRAAELLQRQHPQPVAVSKRLDWRRPNALPTPQPVAASERLPGPEDCDEQGRCWVFDDQLGLPSWTLIRVQGGSLAPDMYWLPAHALPTPEATND